MTDKQLKEMTRVEGAWAIQYVQSVFVLFVFFLVGFSVLHLVVLIIVKPGVLLHFGHRDSQLIILLKHAFGQVFYC